MLLQHQFYSLTYLVPFIMEFLIFGKPYSDNTTDIDKTNKQTNNVYFQNLLSINLKFKTCSYEYITININYKKYKQISTLKEQKCSKDNSKLENKYRLNYKHK